MTAGLTYVALSFAVVALLVAAVLAIGLIDGLAALHEDARREFTDSEWDEIVDEALAFARLKAEVRADKARKSANHPSVLATDEEQVA